MTTTSIYINSLELENIRTFGKGEVYLDGWMKVWDGEGFELLVGGSGDVWGN